MVRSENLAGDRGSLPLSDTLHRPEYLRGYIKTEKEEKDADVLGAIEESVNVTIVTFGHVSVEMGPEPIILELGPLEMPDVLIVEADEIKVVMELPIVEEPPVAVEETLEKTYNRFLETSDLFVEKARAARRTQVGGPL